MKSVSPNAPPRTRGTVTLVALCFVTVMGITLAGYIAICSRAMNMSNRTFHGNLSKQLAEVGIDEALRAFSKNDWSGWASNPTDVSGGTTAWTLTNSTYVRQATRTLTFNSPKFGQGVTGTVKIRIDNYDADQLDSTWNSTTTYRINDRVGYNGIWYHSLRNNNTNQTPSATDLTWWVPNPMPWTWRTSAPYSQYEMVNQKGIWFRCLLTHTSHATTFTSDSWAWSAIPTQRAWSSGVAYDVYDVVAYTDPTTGDVTLYRCITAHTSSAIISTDIAKWSSNVQTVSLAWSSGTVYTRGSVVYYSGGVNRWFYCQQSGTSSTAPSSDTTMWAPMWYDLSYSAVNPGDTVDVGTKYFVGDYINYGGTWYRCTTAHTYASWGADSGKWTSTNASPYLQLFYFGPSSLSTASNSIFYYAGSSWYRYMGNYILALTGNMHAWSSGSITYNPGDAVYYATNSRWYRCILAHTSSGSINPTNTTYWSTAPHYSTAWNSNQRYSQNDTVRYNGVWYRSLQNSNVAQNPATATTYWIGADTTNASHQWNSGTAYLPGSYRCYGGVWYRCLAVHSNKSPNDTTYWTPTWAQSAGVTTGAPVVYVEGTIEIEGSPPLKTQIRASIAPAPLFPNAAAATTTISANSGGTVDSYDSETGTVAVQNGVANTGTPNLNSGTYASHVDTATNYSAVIAAGNTSSTAITLSSTTVKGHLAAPSSTSSPFAPLISVGGSASVKGLSSPASPNVDTSRVSRSPAIPQFNTLPLNPSGGGGGLAATWASVPKGTLISITSTLNLGTPGDTTPSRYYYNGDLTVGTGSLNVIRINGPVILFINGDLTITASGSTGRIDIASTGSAEIHVAGEFKADAGGDGIVNYTSDPKSLIIISDTTSSNSQFYSEGINDLYGVIYMPYSTSSTGYYNNNNNAEIFGAVSANKITYSGANMHIHYDTSLRHATFGGVEQPYTVSQWRELPGTEAATMP